MGDALEERDVRGCDWPMFSALWSCRRWLSNDCHELVAAATENKKALESLSPVLMSGPTQNSG